MNSAYLFDIDGTLLQVDKGFMRPLIADILSSLSIDPSIVNDIRYSGRTDTAIFRDLLGRKSDDEDLYLALKNRYIHEFGENLESSHISILEGVVESIEFLLNRGMCIGLCTGNYEETAYVKLKKAGIDHYFSFGAFGCNHSNRNHLPALAEKAFIYNSGKKIPKKNFVIIGDTPHDIECAKHFGATSVAVATGDFSISELSRHDPDLILETLRSPERWLPDLLV